VLSAEVYRRFCAAVVHRLQVTRARLVEACCHPGRWSWWARAGWPGGRGTIVPTAGRGQELGW